MKTLVELPLFAYAYGFGAYTLYYLFRYRDKSQDWRVSFVPAVFAAVQWPYRVYLRLTAANAGRSPARGARSPAAPTPAAGPDLPSGPPSTAPSGPRATKSSPGPRPIAIDGGDLRDLSELLVDLETAVGTNDAAIRGAILAIAVRTGAMDFTDPKNTPAEIRRPWLWMGQAASAAAAAGDDVLPARILLMVRFWLSVQPKLKMADFMDMRFDPIPPEVRDSIAATARDCLRRLPPQTVLAPTSRVAPNAGQLLVVAEGMVAD